MNLYRVFCKGMTTRIAGNPAHGVSYVVASNAETAYRIVRGALNDMCLGFAAERALDRVELLAENDSYPECGYRLFVEFPHSPQ